jgi:hypothetical protein
MATHTGAASWWLVAGVVLVGGGWLTLKTRSALAERRTRKLAAAVVASAERAGRVYRGVIDGRRIELMVHDCVVYDLADRPNRKGVRPAILKPDFYPWPTVCERQSIHGDSTWITVTLGRTAVGAGGCCATGGTYRTKDGRAWQRESRGGTWIANDSAATS